MSENGVLATADQLFSQPSVRRFRGGKEDPGEDLKLPISGMVVRIRSLTDKEYSAYEMAVVNARRRGGGIREERMKDASCRLIVLCLVDANGNQLATKKHVAAIGDWDLADSRYLYDACVEHCGINSDDMETLVKNSGRTIDDSSPTD